MVRLGLGVESGCRLRPRRRLRVLASRLALGRLRRVGLRGRRLCRRLRLVEVGARVRVGVRLAVRVRVRARLRVRPPAFASASLRAAAAAASRTAAGILALGGAAGGAAAAEGVGMGAAGIVEKPGGPWGRPWGVMQPPCMAPEGST
jgi:hypothetical protein